MPPRSNSPICERSLDLTLIEIGRRDIPQCSPKHFFTQMFYRTFSGGQRPRLAFHSRPEPQVTAKPQLFNPVSPVPKYHCTSFMRLKNLYIVNKEAPGTKPKVLTGSDGILLIRQEIIQSSVSNYWQQGE